MSVKWLWWLVAVLTVVSCCPRGNVTVAVVEDDTTRTLSVQSGLSSKFEVKDDSVLIRLYDQDEKLRATVTISDPKLSRRLKKKSADSISVKLEQDKGTVVITKQGLSLNLIDRDSKGKLVLQLTDSGAFWSVYDSTGKLVWGR